MTELVRGYRGKLGDSLDLSQPFTVRMQTAGNAVYDTCCFGVDAQDKLSDDRYMVFYNQPASPANEITYRDAGGVSEYTVSLGKLPPNIAKLVFTVSIDGDGTMGQIQSHSISIFQNGAELMRLVLSGSDFANEKAIIGAEIYLKTVWRIAVVASGFDGGLADLLSNYGGELADEPTQQTAPPPAPQPAPAPQPQFAQPQYGQPTPPPMQPQFTQPQYGQPTPPPPQPQFTQPHFAQPQYGQPAPPPMQPQFTQPQYGQPTPPPMQPQFTQPQYGQPAPPPPQPQFTQPQYGQPAPQQRFRQPPPQYDPAAPVPPTRAGVPDIPDFRPAPFEVMPLPVIPPVPRQISDYHTVTVQEAFSDIGFELKPVNYETRPLDMLPTVGHAQAFNYNTVPV